MEDAQISSLDFQTNQSCFGVFDGHGGREVAQYCKTHYLRILQESEEF